MPPGSDNYERWDVKPDTVLGALGSVTVVPIPSPVFERVVVLHAGETPPGTGLSPVTTPTTLGSSAALTSLAMSPSRFIAERALPHPGVFVGILIRAYPLKLGQSTDEYLESSGSPPWQDSNLQPQP